MQAKLIISFENLSEPDFLARTETINSSLAANAAFPGPWPAPLTGPASLATLFNQYKNAFNAALTHDDAKISLRNDMREGLTVFLKKLAPYLELVANGSVAALQTTGFELRRDSTRTGGSDPLPAPEDFSVVRGELSGTLIAHARKLKGAASHLVQITEGDPTVEANWKDYEIVVNCNRIEIVGQTPGKVVSVRLRAIGLAGPGAWTSPVSLMAV